MTQYVIIDAVDGNVERYMSSLSEAKKEANSLSEDYGGTYEVAKIVHKAKGEPRPYKERKKSKSITEDLI